MIDSKKLDSILLTPSTRLIEDVRKIKGDVTVLGAAGKMGPSLAILLKNAIEEAGTGAKVYGVSRYSDKNTQKYLEANGVQTFAGDLLDRVFLESLPKTENVIYMAGQKFGTSGNESLTWAMNAWLPGLVSEKYSGSNVVAFSTGNIYPFMPTDSAGATEDITPSPIGEYAQSCLGRERIFEHFAKTAGTPTLIYRLNYALDLRYGVLNDIGQKIWKGIPIDLSMGHVNIIWQGDANEFAIRSLLHCKSPAAFLNITGSEVLAVKELALKIGSHMGKEPIFENTPQKTALLNDASLSFKLFGPATISADQMCQWTAEWIQQGGAQLNKPTHFQQREGKF